MKGNEKKIFKKLISYKLKNLIELHRKYSYGSNNKIDLIIRKDFVRIGRKRDKYSFKIDRKCSAIRNNEDTPVIMTFKVNLLYYLFKMIYHFHLCSSNGFRDLNVKLYIKLRELLKIEFSFAKFNIDLISYLLPVSPLEEFDPR